MIELVSYNNENILLDSRLKEHELIEPQVELLVFHEMAKQLKLPIQLLSYSVKDNSRKMITNSFSNYIEFDFTLLQQLLYRDILNPENLFRHSLLLIFLQIPYEHSCIRISSHRKTHFSFCNIEFNRFGLEQNNFKSNTIFEFQLLHGKKKMFELELASFMALMGLRFREKLFNSIALFQSNTGGVLDKTEIVESIINQERLLNFESFLKTKIY